MGAIRELPFCVRTRLKKIAKKIVCRKVSFEKKYLQKARSMKSLERNFFYIPAPSKKIVVRP